MSGDKQNLKDDHTFFSSTGSSLRDFIVAIANRVYKKTFGNDCWAALLLGSIARDRHELMIVTDLRFIAEFRLIERQIPKAQRLHVMIEWIDNPAKDHPNTITELSIARAEGKVRYRLLYVRHNREGLEDLRYIEQVQAVYEAVKPLLS